MSIPSTVDRLLTVEPGEDQLHLPLDLPQLCALFSVRGACCGRCCICTCTQRVVDTSGMEIRLPGFRTILRNKPFREKSPDTQEGFALLVLALLVPVIPDSVTTVACSIDVAPSA